MILKLTFLSEGIDTTCTSCVGSGTITVSKGGFLLKDLSDNVDALPKMGAAAFELAGVNIVLDNFAANFQLTTEVNVDQKFTFHLFGNAGVALPGFSVSIPRRCVNWVVLRQVEIDSWDRFRWTNIRSSDRCNI